jgi:hypothetical protein
MSVNLENMGFKLTCTRKLICGILFLVLIFPLNGSAQTTEFDDKMADQPVERIRWIAEFPSKIDSVNKRGFFKRVGEFILGRKSSVIIRPVAVIADGLSSFYVLDQESRIIVDVEDYASEKPRAFNKTRREFPSLVAACLLPNGNLLFTDSSKGNIFLMSADQKMIKEFNSYDSLQQPTGIVYSTITDQVWVLETAAHRISVFSGKGELINQLGKRGNSEGEFNFPTHIWVGSDGLVYIVDSMNFRVQIFDHEGNFVSAFGEIGDSSGFFARQKGIATDSFNNIYVVDALFHTVQIFNQEGEFLYNFGSRGREAGDFWMPNGIYIDKEDYIYVADSYNARVQIFQLVDGTK